MNNLSDKILSKIKQEGLRPLAAWQFRLRNGGRWFGLVLAVGFVILGLGLLWYFWSDGPWLHGGRFSFWLFFGRMPLILFGVIILGGFLALLDFRNIGRGYRYSFIKIGLVLLFLAAIAGWSFNYFGLSQRADRAFSASPLYQNREAYLKEVWQNPAKGLIAGEIIEIQADNNFKLRDFSGKIWTINASQAFWRHNLKPQLNLKIKLIGIVDQNNFVATEIRPWLGLKGCGLIQAVGFCPMAK